MRLKITTQSYYAGGPRQWIVEDCKNKSTSKMIGQELKDFFKTIPENCIIDVCALSIWEILDFMKLAENQLFWWKVYSLNNQYQCFCSRQIHSVEFPRTSYFDVSKLTGRSNLGVDVFTQVRCLKFSASNPWELPYFLTRFASCPKALTKLKIEVGKSRVGDSDMLDFFMRQIAAILQTFPINNVVLRNLLGARNLIHYIENLRGGLKIVVLNFTDIEPFALTRFSGGSVIVNARPNSPTYLSWKTAWKLRQAICRPASGVFSLVGSDLRRELVTFLI